MTTQYELDQQLLTSPPWWYMIWCNNDMWWGRALCTTKTSRSWKSWKVIGPFKKICQSWLKNRLILAFYHRRSDDRQASWSGIAQLRSHSRRDRCEADTVTLTPWQRGSPPVERVPDKSHQSTCLATCHYSADILVLLTFQYHLHAWASGHLCQREDLDTSRRSWSHCSERRDTFTWLALVWKLS